MRSDLYPLNAKLAEWAFAQTKDLKLGDDAKVAAFRAGFTGYTKAQMPPFVLLGDTYAADFYWHGAITTQMANDWVKLWSDGKANFVMTEMEDSGFLEALTRLARMHRVDVQRVLVLRTGSNYSMQRPGHTAVESVTTPYLGTRLAVESACWLREYGAAVPAGALGRGGGEGARELGVQLALPPTGRPVLRFGA